MTFQNSGRMLRCFGVLLGFSAIQVSAATITEFFGSPDFVWHHPSGGATPNHIWVTGDYWEQAFTGTGLGSAASLTLNLVYDDNILSGATALFDALVNGITVGSFSVGPGVTGLNSYLFGFPSIAGPDYTIRVLETNTIPGGQGSLSLLATNETSNAVLSDTVPEPGTFALLGLGGLLVWRLRRRYA